MKKEREHSKVTFMQSDFPVLFSSFNPIFAMFPAGGAERTPPGGRHSPPG